ncbi:hypothetical protein CPB84DRAFT_1751501 [Gymnopilus junonius]|uniref:Uncharacterized protein n=1 Tax=Gymnopilus junonius TaxID=109634 RepID=A0A9P5TI12_GYMJU|nr:hypothetical protein CPB84DRAFT_1751501 [Gymnopilus junonius]
MSQNGDMWRIFFPLMMSNVTWIFHVGPLEIISRGQTYALPERSCRRISILGLFFPLDILDSAISGVVYTFRSRVNVPVDALVVLTRYLLELRLLRDILSLFRARCPLLESSAPLGEDITNSAILPFLPVIMGCHRAPPIVIWVASDQVFRIGVFDFYSMDECKLTAVFPVSSSGNTMYGRLVFGSSAREPADWDEVELGRLSG